MGRGAAGQLLDALERWARQDGAVWLSLGVSDRNERARRFYLRLGFSPSGESEPLHSDPTARAVQMRKPLPPARLRFAPGSSGPSHGGHARSAIWTWILSYRYRGEAFVRFEDTDRTKIVAGAQRAILEDLGWLDCERRACPASSAKLTDKHTTALETLTEAGCAYRDGGAVRFRLPPDGVEGWEDLVRGSIKIPNSSLANPVLVRSDGTPTFFLASTVDDPDDAITHLVRVTAMMAATATQRHIWRALGVSPPAMAHIPQVTGPAGQIGPLHPRRRHTALPARTWHRYRSGTCVSGQAAIGQREDPTNGACGDHRHPRSAPCARRPLRFDQAALERLDRRQRDLNPRHPIDPSFGMRFHTDANR